MDRRIRVLIVDDHDVFRHGLARLLDEAGVEVVAQASGGRAGVRLAAELAPDVVLMDLAMPGLSGLEATCEIAASARPVHVVAVSGSDDDVSMLDALLAGAVGYVLKGAPIDEVVVAIEHAARGDVVIPPRVAPELMRRLRDVQLAPAHDGAVTELSAREHEVLELIVAGHDNAAIAAELFISPNTVKRHVASIFAKLGVESRLQASVAALRRGLVA